MFTVDNCIDAYIACALWSSHDDLGDFMDAHCDASDFHPDAIASMRADLSDFLDLCEREGLLTGYPGTPAQYATDLWLTRNGHGTGFWDRGHDEIGPKLAHWAETMGSRDLYIGDDALIHVQ